MKRIVLLVAILVLALAVVPASAAPSGEISVFYSESEWVVGGELYVTDKLSVAGSFASMDSADSELRAAVGYDLSRTDLAVLRATAGVLAITDSSETVYTPKVGVSGRAMLADNVFVSGSLDYAFQNDDVAAQTIYDIGIGYTFSGKFYVGARARGNLSGSTSSRIGLAFGMAF